MTPLLCLKQSKVLRYVGASDGNMAEGSLRLDINVSIRPKGEEGLRYVAIHQLCMHVDTGGQDSIQLYQLSDVPVYSIADIPQEVPVFDAHRLIWQAK
jgi:Asp-tRNA(Asn)/Glu-tRNA(Gln) amidotransferase B subunit